MQAALINYRAVYTIDAKTDLQGETLLPPLGSSEWSTVEIGDRFIVEFTLDDSVLDSDSTVDTTPSARFNPLEVRTGNFGNTILKSFSIRRDSGHRGTFDPSGADCSETTRSSLETSDSLSFDTVLSEQGSSEQVDLLVTEGNATADIDGRFQDAELNFRNIDSDAISVLDYLDDDTTFFADLFGGPTCVACNAEDLQLLTTDILKNGTVISSSEPRDRPLFLGLGVVAMVGLNSLRKKGKK